MTDKPIPTKPTDKPVIPAAQLARLEMLAGTRSQTLPELIADCIRWLEVVPGEKTRTLEAAVVVPNKAPPLHPDGRPYCRCSGPCDTYGPWHTCERRRPTEQAEGDFS